MEVKKRQHSGKKHPVVAVNPNGKVAGIFDSIKDAVAIYGMDRHSITDSCKKGTLCRGLRWYYEEDFRKIYMDVEKLKFTPYPDREQVSGRLVKGHKVNLGWKNWSEKSKESRRRFSRELCKRLINDPNSNFGPNRKVLSNRCKKVICIDSGEIYNSVAECSRKTGLGVSALHASMRRMYKCGGKKFMFLSEYNEVQKRINSNVL